MEWTFFILAFIFGYITCKLFYFIKATRASLVLIRASQLIAVSILTKALEDFYFAKVYRMEKMVESGESDHNITAFSYRMEEEVNYYKKKSIDILIDLHPDPFKQILEFDNWDSAMQFLEKNKGLMAAFLSREKND